MLFETHLNEIIKTIELSSLASKLKNCSNIKEFISEISNIINNQLIDLPNSIKGFDYSSTIKPNKLLEEINLVGWDHLIDINDDFNELKFCIFDNYQRSHIINVVLPNNYPNVKPKVNVELPVYFELPTWNNSFNLQNVINMVASEISKYESLFEVIFIII